MELWGRELLHMGRVDAEISINFGGHVVVRGLPLPGLCSDEGAPSPQHDVTIALDFSSDNGRQSFCSTDLPAGLWYEPGRTRCLSAHGRRIPSCFASPPPRPPGPPLPPSPPPLPPSAPSPPPAVVLPLSGCSVAEWRLASSDDWARAWIRPSREGFNFFFGLTEASTGIAYEATVADVLAVTSWDGASSLTTPSFRAAAYGRLAQQAIAAAANARTPGMSYSRTQGYVRSAVARAYGGRPAEPTADYEHQPKAVYALERELSGYKHAACPMTNRSLELLLSEHDATSHPRSVSTVLGRNSTLFLFAVLPLGLLVLMALVASYSLQLLSAATRHPRRDHDDTPAAAAAAADTATTRADPAGQKQSRRLY